MGNCIPTASKQQGWRQALECGTLVATSTAYTSILRQCMVAKDLTLGRLLHSHLSKCGQLDEELRNLVVQIYAKCGSIQDAGGVVERSCWNVYSWTLMVAAYAHKGHLLRAVETFQDMDLHGIKPNRFMFLTILGLVSAIGHPALSIGIQLHARLTDMGMGSSILVRNAVVTMYGKCRNLQLAEEAFNRMPRRDVVSWNAMLAAYVHNGHLEDALRILETMETGDAGAVPDTISYVVALGACSSACALEEGKQIHGRILERGFDCEDLLGNTLVHMYARCGSLVEARSIFDKLEHKQQVTWSFLMGQYVQEGHSHETRRLFQLMECEGVKANKYAFIALLDACEDVEEGREVEKRVFSSGMEADVAVLGMYARCGDLDSAWKTFHGMGDRSLAAWNMIISAYAQRGHSTEALSLYRRMEPEGVKANDMTYVSALGAISSLGKLAAGKYVHARVMESGYSSRVFVCNSVLHMYTRCGSLVEARALFESMATKDVVTWNCMINAYAQLGYHRQALDLYSRMEGQGIKPNRISMINALGACVESPADARFIHARAAAEGFDCDDVVLGTALVNVYAKCGCLEEATCVFEKLKLKNVVSWSAMIAAYAESGLGRDAQRLLHLMDLEGVRPNDVTLVSILDACSGMGAVSYGTKIHSRLASAGLEADLVVGNALVNMYGKCGEISTAKSFFDGMVDKDVVTWAAMVASYAQHGHPDEALATFRLSALDGILANQVTFVSVLFSCSHSGVVKRGWEHFVSMVGDYGVAPIAEHYGCMVDLLSRAGWLEQAEDLIINMPFEPDRAAWMSLLGACNLHSKADMGRRVAELMSKSHTSSGSMYIVLSNMYATGSRCAPQTDVSGTSVIEVKGRVYQFVSGPRSVWQQHHIVAELDRLQDLTGAAEQDYVHSEKAALAFGLLYLPGKQAIRLVKDCGICRECHESMKLISKLRGRRIMIRDLQRFHHFEDGICSCTC